MNPVTPDFAAETPLTLAAAARRLPPVRRAKPVHPATVLRWVLRGLLAPDGRRVRLAARRVGGSWCTTAEAVERFLAALSALPGPAAAPTPRTPGQRQRASEMAAQQLAAAGI
jgi:hypothetical protein